MLTVNQDSVYCSMATKSDCSRYTQF